MAERIDMGLNFPEHFSVTPTGALEGPLSEDDYITVVQNGTPVLAVQLFPLPTLATRFEALIKERLHTTPPQDLLSFLDGLQGKALN